MSENEDRVKETYELAKHGAEVDEAAGINDLTYLPANGYRRDISDFKSKDEDKKPEPKADETPKPKPSPRRVKQ